jgi:hypothetical protein
LRSAQISESLSGASLETSSWFNIAVRPVSQEAHLVMGHRTRRPREQADTQLQLMTYLDPNYRTLPSTDVTWTE